MKKIFVILIFFAAQHTFSQVNDLLIARNTGKYPIWTGDTMRVFGFTRLLKDEVKIPGPTLIYNEGDSVILDLWNVSQGAPHTIHLHGLDVDQLNDGVPHLSFDVAHMDHGYYRFKAPHAGTYLYHCHVVSTIHVQAGMYGLIIIRPPDGSFTTWNGGHIFNKEVAWMTSELDTNWHKDKVLEHPHDTAHAIMKVQIPEYHPQHFLINGLSEHQLSDSTVAVKSALNEKVYLRIANIGYMGNKIKIPASFNARIVSSDGRPLPAEEASDSLIVYPGERYGILLEATSAFAGNISVDYFNLNTNSIINTQSIPAVASGFFSSPELQHQKIKAYPNPVQTSITLRVKNFNVASWRLYNNIGTQQNIKVLKTGENEYRIYLEQFPSGWYYIKASNKLGEVIGTTLIKE